jgi:hypothetical protein
LRRNSGGESGDSEKNGDANRSRSLRFKFKQARKDSRDVIEDDSMISENLEAMFQRIKLPDDPTGDHVVDKGDYWQNQFVQVLVLAISCSVTNYTIMSCSDITM